MSRFSSGSCRATVAIPLYKSALFFENIVSNIENISDPDIEIVISDRHCFDDTIDRLSKRYAGDARVRCLKHQDKLDWVAHINALLKEARGNYWRFLPHDDLSPPGSLEALITALDSNADAILSYGPTLAIDGDGRRLIERDCLTPHPIEAAHTWSLGLVLQMFWRGYFNGAFKGVLRRTTVMKNRLLIRSTKDQIFPERCWLFALCLLGRFHFVPEASYIKRFYCGSIHSGWEITGSNYLSAAETMSEYLNKLLTPGTARRYGKQDLFLNAQCFAQWRDSSSDARPPYMAALGAQVEQIRSLRLPHSAGFFDFGRFRS